MIRSTFAFTTMLIALALLVVGCGEKSTDSDEHAIEVTMTYTPTSATVNTPINFLFEVEDEGEHLGGLSPHVEIEKEGATDHVEMTVSEDTDDPGHYRGTHTFTEAGSYDIHFEFMHDGDDVDEEFQITVQ
ncbi:MAG: FixH family protein [Candidatus Marinimicrobia bacterium]|nr:FixH family protein [Candidatus Neomarinimicrobiota bacterium]